MRISPSLLLLVALGLSACTASGPLYTPSAPPGRDQALIYLYRLHGFYGRAVPMKVEVNGKEVGILPNESYTSIYVPSGEVKLSATRWQDFTYPESKRITITGTLASGETYYLRISQEQSGNLYTTKLDPVSPTVGEQDLKNLKRNEAAK